ncbi:MAG: amidohydrolase family protein [Candidatus Sulfotelmatobacter sp.]
MRIDAHQHFWIYDPHEYEWIDESMGALRRNFLPADLKPELDNSGMQGCVAVQARQTLEETRWLLELAGQSPFIAGVVGWVDLLADDVRLQLKDVAANPKLVGIRHIVQTEPDDRFLLRPDFQRGIATLEEFDLAYDILIYTKHLPVAAQFVQQFPRQRFVLDHLAKPPIKSGNIESWADGIRKLAEFPNVYCKLSGLVTEADWRHWKPEDIFPYLDVAFVAFGTDRLMAGSDWPVCLVTGFYARTLNLVKDYVNQHYPAAREAVLGGNAQRFWRLP